MKKNIKQKINCMQAILFLAITIIVRSYSIQPDSSVPAQIASEVNITDLPEDYTLQTQFQLQYPASSIVYSPDQNWIVYTTQQDLFTNLIYYRRRSSLTNYSSVRIGSPKPMQEITKMAFSTTGDLLFVGTSTFNLFVCKFSPNIQYDDCSKTFFLGNQTRVLALSANSNNKIVAAGDDNLWIFNFTSTGDLALQFHVQFQNVSRLSTIWHPKGQKDVLIIGGCNKTVTYGFLTVYNITDRAVNTEQTTCVYNISPLKDGQNLLVTQQQIISQYTLTIVDVTRLGTVFDKDIAVFQVSQDGSLVVGTDVQSGIAVYQVKLPSQITTKNYLNQNTDSQLVTLNKLYHVDFKNVGWFTISSDANDILFAGMNSPQMQRYALCVANTFYSNFQCLNCSTNCKTCHINNTLCLDCVDNTFLLINGSCKKCGNFSTGCLSCSNSTNCLQCDTIAGFIKAPSNGVCQCSDFNYLKQGYCVLCDGKSICKKCTSPDFCLTCNKINNWQESSVNGTCVCQDYFFNASGTCTLCNSLRVCTACANSSFCTKCDTTKGFSETPINGSCVCPNSYTLNAGKCIACSVNECISCYIDNICRECDSDSSLSDGKCVKGSISMILLFVGIGLVVILGGMFVYCKCKNMKKKRLEESLLTSEKAEGTTTDGGIITQKKDQAPFLAKNTSKLIKEKVQIQPKLEQVIVVPKASKLDNEKNGLLAERKDQSDESDDDEPSFIGQYKKLMEKSEVQGKNDQKSFLRQIQRKNQQKIPSKLQKADKKVKSKLESNFDRQVKKIQHQKKGNSKLQKQQQRLQKNIQSETKFDEQDEFQQKSNVKPGKSDLKKKPQAKSKYVEEQKPGENAYSVLKKGANPKISSLNKEKKPAQTLGFADVEQAALIRLTDEEKMMLKMVRGSFGEI